MYNYQDWENFCNYLIGENRYILNGRYKKLTDEILKLAKGREDSLEKDSIFWRAKTSRGLRVAQDSEIVSDKYTQEEMSAPSKEKAKDGRANPAGISYLYLAEDLETAVAEIKPFIGDRITIASFANELPRSKLRGIKTKFLKRNRCKQRGIKPDEVK